MALEVVGVVGSILGDILKAYKDGKDRAEREGLLSPEEKAALAVREQAAYGWADKEPPPAPPEEKP